MGFILLPNFEIVSQLYVGLDASQVRFSDEEMLFLYISLLREFAGFSEFLSFFQWQDFVFGQEHILGSRCLFRLDASNSLQEKASRASIAFWTSKRSLLGSREMEELYLFTSESLGLYWARLSSVVLLRGAEQSPGAGAVRDCPIYYWMDERTLEGGGLTCSRGGLREHRVAESLGVCFAMISLFILTQFMFLDKSRGVADPPQSLYSKESCITMVKFFQRSLTALIRILSLFTPERSESGPDPRAVPAAFQLFFDKVDTGQ
ncbi:putative beta tubulin folding factor domain-containing protein, partial [Cryptosporidium canis]